MAGLSLRFKSRLIVIRDTFWIVLTLFCFPGFAQTPVIFDTDIDSDVDDVQALAMLHAYEQADLIRLLGVIVTSDDSHSFQCVDAINVYYGKSKIPIGFLKDDNDLRSFSKYTEVISEEFDHGKKSLQHLSESALLYRKLLAESADTSVVILTVGHLSSLQDLLESAADEISPFSGKELVDRKVKKWICMGGQYPEGKEANFYRPDPASTVYCLEHWNKEVIFCGWEVGNKIITGGQYLRSRLDRNHPVYRSYELYNNFAGRPAWDQVAVLLLDEEVSARYFELHDDGYVSVLADGSNTWHSGQQRLRKKHAYVSIREGVNADLIARTMDELVLNISKE